MKAILSAPLVAGLVVSALVASTALAQTTPSLTAAISKIEAKGYKVHDIEREGSWLEIDATTRDGVRVELIVDAATAGVLRESADD